MEFQWDYVVQAANLAISLVVAFGGLVKFIELLKGLLNPTPRQSQFLATAVCVVYTVLSMTVQGVIAPDTLTAGNAATIFLAVLAASQSEYQRTQRNKDNSNGNV